ncbi:MAG: LacI family DNA-binding transcriptional regulator [Lachnospiraceae bacterium]|nr:LacI family DNA-binding transcriptional regulator [Lachnospiraceae bacterium]
MNIYDVSEKAGVSIATVSRVLNGNPNVSEQTRNKVLAVMEELGYTPNVFARGLGLNTMKTIGIMCTDSSDIYLANAVYYTEHELRSHDYDSILCCTGYDLENKKKSLELLLSKRVDAIIMVGSKFLEPKPKDNAYIFAASKQVPIMLVNGYLEGPNIFCTLCDDFHAVHDITHSLIKSGRRNTLYLYTSNSYSGTRKREGFMKALSENGLPVREEYMQMCKKDISDARDTITRLYESGLTIDSVITSDDALAVGALKFALLNNLSVPEDISIIGYNNSILATCAEPELTSIDTKVEALCINTVNTLMRIFDGCNVPSKTTISADIVYRKTTNI